MRHSDPKTTFATGAQRDDSEDKGMPALITWEMIRRLSLHLERGAKHYGSDNWRQGMPFRRTADSLIRHIFQWLDRDEEEDHLAAILCNAMFLMQFEKEHPELDDRWREKNLAPALTSGSADAKIGADAATVNCVECGTMIPNTGFARCLECMKKWESGQCSLHLDDKGGIRHGPR